MEQQVEDLETLFTSFAPDRFILVGYSMGGRVALAYTVRYPKRVSTLILESSSPGLKTEEEREERRAADKRLAERILTDGLPVIRRFLGKIFPCLRRRKSFVGRKTLAMRNERLSQSEIGLANSLYGIGTGSQNSYWDSSRYCQSSGFARNGGTRHEIRKYFPGNAEKFP